MKPFAVKQHVWNSHIQDAKQVVSPGDCQLAAGFLDSWAAGELSNKRGSDANLNPSANDPESGLVTLGLFCANIGSR